MYLKLLLQKFEGGGKSGGSGFARVGVAVVVVLLIGGGIFAFREFSKAGGATGKTQPGAFSSSVIEPGLRPGGQEPIVMSRSALPGSLMPEFLSATLLPGRGMDVLQITASIPEKGEVRLLTGGGLPEAAAAMTGVSDDADGSANLTFGGTILSPWAGRMGGVPEMDNKTVVVNMQGKLLHLPATTVESSGPAAFGGLLLKQPSASVQQRPMGDGGVTTATYAMGDYEGRWPSQSETKVSVLLSSRVLEMSVDVKNVGSGPMPVGVGWAPRFAIPGGDRSKATLSFPALMRSVPRDEATRMPSGRLEAVSGTKYDFNTRSGLALGTLDLNDTFVHLKTPLDDRPVIELRDPGAKFGLRLTALTPSIKAIHVFSPANASFVSISPQMNYDDPFGKEWPKGEDTGMAELQPGQTAHWKIRLELFPLTNPVAPAL